jgi:hypothetical protein
MLGERRRAHGIEATAAIGEVREAQGSGADHGEEEGGAEEDEVSFAVP